MLDTSIFMGPLVATFVIASALLVLLYKYSVKNHDYWKKRGIPQAKTMPFFGSIWDLFFTPFHEIESNRFKELGAIYGHYEADKPLLSVAEPSLIKDVLVKDFPLFVTRREFNIGHEIFDNMLFVAQGEDWKRLRTIVSPTFSTGKIKRMHEIFKDCSQTAIQNFQKEGAFGKPVDLKRIYGAYTMDVIASSAFSTKLDSHNDPDNEFVSKAKMVFTAPPLWKNVIFLFCPKLFQILKIDPFPGGVFEFFKDVTLQIVQERRKTGQVRNDFLQLLMDTEKEDIISENAGKEAADSCSNYELEGINPTILKNVTSKHLSLNEMVAQCALFFVVGYDTTASTLSFASYLLALNPEAQDKLREEVDQVFKENDGDVSYENVQSMKYLDNVISETLRLYPPATRIERTVSADYKLGDSGITLEKGVVVTVPTCAMHRDPKLFPNPEHFDPDRFTPENRTKIEPYSYLPFGAGPRNCVGMRFALVEVKVCLAYVIRNFILKRSPSTKVPLEFGLGQTLLQAQDVKIEMDPRKDV